MAKNIDHLMRQLDIIPLEKLDTPITVIGAGAIGSLVVMTLAKMGFENLSVWDFDIVSVENMSCQWYGFDDIKKPKVEALAAAIKRDCRIDLKTHNEKFEGTGAQIQTLGKIVITAVDSMAVRQTIWNACKDNGRIFWYIDPRMAAEYALSFVMNPNNTADITSYEKTLYTDQNAVEERCTAKATMYTSTLIAGYVCKAVKDVVTGNDYARITHWDIAGNQMQNWGKKKETTEIQGEENG